MEIGIGINAIIVHVDFFIVVPLTGLVAIPAKYPKFQYNLVPSDLVYNF